MSIRIADPEYDFVPPYLRVLSTLSIIVNLLTLYFLIAEFFELPLSPFLGG